MVDTTAPTVTVLTNLDAVLTAGALATLDAQVSDNCANLTISFGFARAEQAVGRPWHNSDTLTSASAEFLDTVPGALVTENGVRSYLIVSDGLHSDTINVSRRVRRTFASDVSTEAGVWVPVRTTARLDDSSFAPVLQALLGQSAYDPYRCRLFRWYQPDALPTDTNHWVEYSSATDSLFNLLPSRLSWVKAAQTMLLNFGSGVTLSLRDTFTLNLLPNDWTDFALPYGFSINIGDILDATGSAADSLQFYAWTRSANSYTTLPLYIGSLPDDSSHLRTRALSAAARDGYSVYNPSLASRTLRIPPVCVPMSTVIAKRLAKSTAADAWALRLEATRPDHSPIATLLCGYQSDLGDRTYYPPSPSFASLALRVRDTDRGAMHGHAIDHAADRFGGFAYDLVFTNSARVPQNVVLNISGLARLADSMDVRLVETSSGAVLTPQGAPLSFTIPAQGSLSRTLAVGGSGYYRHLLAHVRPFAQFAAFPNPFHGLLSVQFLMPEGVARVDCRLFDLKGRTAWFYSQTHITPEATNKIVWNSRDSQSPLAAGRFILKLQAFDTNGKLLKSLNQNLINLP
jgi:hypothetical protein